MANVAPGVNYPDPAWKTFPRVVSPVSTTGASAGVPKADANQRSEGNSYGPGVGRRPVTPPVQLAALTLIQNQAGG